MIFYYSIFMILSLLSFYEIFCIKNKNGIIVIGQKKIIHRRIVYIWCVILIIGIWIIASIRWETGGDWENYLYMFDTMNEMGMKDYFSIYKGLYGNGFILLSGIICMMTDSYTIYLAIIACIVMALSYKTIINYSVYPLTSIWYMFAISFGYMFATPRNGIALAISVFSIKYIYEKKFLKFILCVLIATSFHNTAIFFILAYVVFHFKTNISKILFIGLLAFGSSFAIGGLLKVVENLEFLPNGVQYRLSEYLVIQHNTVISVNFDILIRVFTRGFLIFLIFIYLYKRRGDSRWLNGIINLYLFSMLIYILVSRVGSTFNRIAFFYEECSQYYIIASCFWYIRNKKVQKFILYGMIFIYLFAKFTARLQLGYADTYVPYKTIF